jgi:hypothetical protein
VFEDSTCRRPFERYLPGGGFVAIEVASIQSVWRKPRFLGRLIIERRTVSRGGNHQPPVIASVSGSSLEEVVGRLFPKAQSNASIAEALLRLGNHGGQTERVGP